MSWRSASDVRVEVFPVSPVHDPDPPRVRRRRRDGTIWMKPCMSDGIWYADWHDAARGPYRHHAQDIFAPEGSPVLAPSEAVVVGSSADTGPTPKGGHWVKLEVRRAADGAALRTYLMTHLARRPLVSRGQVVQAGEQLGEVGRTGNARSTCPHLHIGARLYRGGRAVNIYRELIAVDPRKAPAPRRPPEPTPASPATPATSDPDGETDCPCRRGEGEEQ